MGEFLAELADFTGEASLYFRLVFLHIQELLGPVPDSFLGEVYVELLDVGAGLHTESQV